MGLVLTNAVEKFRNNKPIEPVVTVEGSIPALPPAREPEDPRPSWAILTGVEKLKPFIDPEITRFALSSVQVDPIKRRMVATDAKSLVVIPIEECGGREPFLVRGDMLDYAVRLQKKFYKDYLLKASLVEGIARIELVRHADAKDGDSIVFSHPTPEGRFPKVDSVIPTDDFKLEVRFDARMLKRIAEHAMATAETDDSVSLQFRFQSPDKAARIESYHDGVQLATYVLMPLVKL